MTSPPEIVPATVPSLLERAAVIFGEEVAVTDRSDHATFRHLRRAAVATARALEDTGVGRGDRVGICLTKSVLQVLAIVGVLEAGAIVVPILPRLRADNIRHIGLDGGLRLIVVDAEREREVAEALPAIDRVDVASIVRRDAEGRADESSGVIGIDTAEQTSSAEVIGIDTAAIIYSSGSTGRPKGIVLSHRNLVDGARITSTYLGTVHDDRIAGVLSLNFDYGLNQLWQALLTGASLHLHDFLLPADLFGFLDERAITALPLMPVLVSRMFDRRLLKTRPGPDPGAVRYISTSGGPVSDRMIAELTTTFPRSDLFLMYGLTEAFRSTYLPPDQVATRPRSIGRAIPDVEIVVLDEELNAVAPGEPGELVHRGGCVAKGYWNAPAETAARFREIDRFPGETVVFSGDVVTRDEDGYLYFVGRKDSMIKTMGFRVSPTEVEEVAVRFPGVTACVALGVDNVEVGADIALAYTTSSPVDERGFRRFLQRDLPRHMVPRYLVEHGSFPATGNDGKIDRPAVERDCRARLAAQPNRDGEREDGPGDVGPAGPGASGEPVSTEG